MAVEGHLVGLLKMELTCLAIDRGLEPFGIPK